ncbi:MAG: glycosyltransferase family 2 protein [Bacteroidetes bacterium]|nr:glycosyltransferase family 2 protein [Bacteroidota bacterium]
MSEEFIKVVFWLCLLLVLYTYVGYGLLLYVLVFLKRKWKKPKNTYLKKDTNFPEVSFVVAAYNEENWIEEKVKNSLRFDYPKDKIQFIFVTDGSTDETPARIRSFIEQGQSNNLQLFHRNERSGKLAAVERIMRHVDTPITIFSDANTLVNPKAIKNIVWHYRNPRVGAVAGEKRIQLHEKEEASGAGEGFYWKYESTLKRWDAELYSVVGAAGELFSVRTSLYETVPPDTIIEDFYLTLRIAQKGYRVQYEPQAYAAEKASASVQEELKRKIRIAAGGLQSIYRLSPLLNIFKYGVLSFQYISHRVLRWTLAPLALPLIFLTNAVLAYQNSMVYQLLFAGQIIFYLFALLGYLLEKRQLKIKTLFIPYYFCMMNYAVYLGFFRILKGNQSNVWERAKRAI